jgi:hypothetical protein
MSCVWVLAGCDKPAPPEPSADNLPVPAARPARIHPEPEETRASPLAAALAIQSPEEREEAIAEIAWNALESDPEVAREAFEKLSQDSEPRLKLLRHFAMNLAAGNPEEAFEWVSGLESDLEKSAAIERIAWVISEEDPARAAQLLSEFGIEGRGFDVAVVRVLQRWASQNPSDAAAWVALFPAGEVRETGIRTVISEWTESDPKTAISWMAGLTEREIRDEGALAIAIVLAGQDPEVRSEWLGYADPVTRGEIEAMKAKALEETGEEP